MHIFFKGPSSVSCSLGQYLNQWVYVAVTLEGNILKIFLNGNLATTNEVTPVVSFTEGDELYIGTELYSPEGSNLDGYISNFRFVTGKAVSISSVPTQPLVEELGDGFKTILNLNVSSEATMYTNSVTPPNGLDKLGDWQVTYYGQSVLNYMALKLIEIVDSSLEFTFIW